MEILILDMNMLDDKNSVKYIEYPQTEQRPSLVGRDASCWTKYFPQRSNMRPFAIPASARVSSIFT